VSDPAARLRAAATLLQTADIATVEHVQPGQGRTVRTFDTVPLAGLLIEAANDIEDNGAHWFKYGQALVFAGSLLTDTEGTNHD
jgi:hypothetical protein